MDISEVSLRFVELIPKGRGFVLGKHGERPISEGVIAEGEIKNMETFCDVLRKVRKDFGISFVRASLSEAHAYLADIEVPRVPFRDLRASLELQLDQYVPLAPNDLFFDYTIIDGGIPGQKNSPHLKLAVSVVPRSPVLKYIEAFSGAGLTLLSLEVDADALVRAILPPTAMETTMIIEMGRVKTGVYVVKNRVVRFASELDFGAKVVSAGLQKKLSVSIGELSKILASCYGETAPSPEASEVLREFFGELLEEIRKHHMYWNSRHAKEAGSGEEIERIILAGSQSALYGLPEYLSAGLREQVEMANPWTNLSSFSEYIPEISRENSLRYATAIGLALHPYEPFLV